MSAASSWPGDEKQAPCAGRASVDAGGTPFPASLAWSWTLASFWLKGSVQGGMHLCQPGPPLLHHLLSLALFCGDHGSHMWMETSGWRGGPQGLPWPSPHNPPWAGLGAGLSQMKLSPCVGGSLGLRPQGLMGREQRPHRAPLSGVQLGHHRQATQETCQIPSASKMQMPPHPLLLSPWRPSWLGSPAREGAGASSA